MCYRKGSFSTLKMIQQIITTDNCDEPRRSLHLNWPNATLPLCVFHVLQEVWGWLYERQHGVSKDDRVQIMKLFRNLVCAHKVQGYERTYENIFNFLATLKYKNCVQYFEKLCELSKSWVKYFRTEKVIRGSNADNYVEAQFLAVKNTTLRRQRQYKINMLFEKLMVDPFVPNAPFLYPLNTSENLMVYMC